MKKSWEQDEPPEVIVEPEFVPDTEPWSPAGTPDPDDDWPEELAGPEWRMWHDQLEQGAP